MTPDERYLLADLRSNQWNLGEMNGCWQFKELKWPHLYASVFSKDKQEFTLKLDCQGYPNLAPTGHLWSIELDTPLPREHWPKSLPEYQNRPRSVSIVFRQDSWDYAGKALYLPVDRTALTVHSEWNNLPTAWRPEKGICQYFECVHEVLNGYDYACEVDSS